MDSIKKEIVERVRCRSCGATVAEPGDLISAWPYEDLHSMPSGRPYDLVLEGRFVVAARCECGTATLCSDAARAWKMARWRHHCTECQQVHESVREQLVQVYGAEKPRAWGV